MRIAYDGDGNRVQENVGGTNTFYQVAEINPTGYAQVLEERPNTLSSSANKVYVWGLQLVAMADESKFPFVDPSPLRYYGYDGHGSVRFLIDPSGKTTDTYDYDAFGNLIAQTRTTQNNYLFAGEQFDPALGVYYNRARYYDERLGRFWTADSFEGRQQDPMSLHHYLYANADPLDFSDPSGASITDYTPYGYAIEARIQIQYQTEFNGNDILLGQWTLLGKNPRLKPDIFDKTRRIWMDIKPMTLWGVADGVATAKLYEDNFQSLKYAPDTIWKPTYQNPIAYDGKLFYVVNVEGILFYTADTNNRRRLNQLRTFADVRTLVRQIDSSNRNLWFNFTIFGIGATGALSLINFANQVEQQNLIQIKSDELVAEDQTVRAA